MGFLRLVRSTPCALLLVVQLSGVLLYPFMDESFVGRSVFALFGLLVLALAILTVRATPMLSWVAGLIALPAVALLLVQVFTGNEDLAPWASGFEAALYFYAAVAMIRYMFEDEHITTDELFAIGAVFTLVAWAFAHVYVVLQALQPDAFTAAVNPGEARGWTELLFLSFTTLSNTGLSDIVPITGHTRSVVMLEEVAGVLFIGGVVARLVAMSGRVREPKA